MSIVPLLKATVVGLELEGDSVLRELQELGCLHLIPLQPRQEQAEPEPTGRLQRAKEAFAYLSSAPAKRHQLSSARGFDFDEVVEGALRLKQQVRVQSDRRDFLRQRLDDVRPWGDFVFPEASSLAGYRLWFYRLPRHLLDRLGDLEAAWQEVHRDHRDSWIVVVSREEPTPDALPVPRVHVGGRPLSELEEELEQLEVELEDLAAERVSLTRWLVQMARSMGRVADRSALQQASAQSWREHGLFAVQGWLPSGSKEALQQLCERRQLALLLEEPTLAERPPTLLEGPEAIAGGEELVRFYQVPAYRSWDPSAAVYFSFAAFFAMIVGDAAYALTLLFILGLLYRRLGRSRMGRRLRRLALTVVLASIVWGVAIGSWFGLQPPPSHPLGRLRILDITDYGTMMRLSVGVGVLHLILAHLGRMRSLPSLARAVPIGWIITLLSGYLLWLGYAAPAMPWTLAAGAGLILFGAGAGASSARRGVLRWCVAGLKELSQVPKAFGDVLSYLRLFALGLASAMLAVTFSNFCMFVHHKISGAGLFLCIVIWLVAHPLNLLLAVIGGLIHGLRLNVIEFFNWGVPEEGYPFAAFTTTKEAQTWRSS